MRLEITNAEPKDKDWLDMYMLRNKIRSRGEWLSKVVKALKSKEITL